MEQIDARTGRSQRFGRLLAPVLVAIAALLAACGGDDGESGDGTTTTASSTPVTVDRSTAVWPTEDTDERPVDAVDAARTFAVEVLHFEDPVVGELRRGDSRSGEVDVRPTADGPVTMLLVRQLSGEETWSVLGAGTDDIQIDSPTAGQAVGDPVVVRGRGRAFEGVIDVAVLADGDDEPIGSGTVMGGGDELRPFEGAIDRDRTDAARGALVLFTRSAKDGAVWSASVLRIAFAGAGLANPASAYCEEQGGTVDIEETDDGQRGVCVLPDGTRVDEWELYRSRATCSASGLPARVEGDPTLPPPVAAMRADLARAAVACDYEALRRLADRGGPAVRFSWGGDTDPIAFWRAAEARGEDPPPLRALRRLLDLPATETDGGNGRVQYVWPPAFAAERPTDAQLQQIVDIGLYDLATLRRWVETGNNYLGYRILVTADGDWTAFVAGD